jgi:hypothetical protein
MCHTNRYYNVLMTVLIIYVSLSGWVAAESVAVTDWVNNTSLIALLVNGFLIGLLTVSQMLAQPFGKVITCCDSAQSCCTARTAELPLCGTACQVCEHPRRLSRSHRHHFTPHPPANHTHITHGHMRLPRVWCNHARSSCKT